MAVNLPDGNGIDFLRDKLGQPEELLSEVSARYRKKAEEKQITFAVYKTDREAVFDPK